MIDIVEKKECCGCHACASVCPKQCISMQADEEGFLYPLVDLNACIHCSRCEKVCPVIHSGESRMPIKVYAAKNKQLEIRLESSSGGVFSLLAEKIIRLGGVVFGAKYDDQWNVVHAWTDTLEGTTAFRGAKYVQSVIGKSYQEARSFLKQGRWVMFTGTPCQIKGLLNFLGKVYDKLLTVDTICHGVPSPLVWQTYLKSINPVGGRIAMVSMRDKTEGWKQYQILIQSDSRLLYFGKAARNLYIQGYLADLYLRPSCHDCPSKKGRSGSDCTLGDFWGIRRYYPEMDDNRGVSLVLVNSFQGMNFFQDLDVSCKEATYEQGLQENPCMERSVPCPTFRKEFWCCFSEEGMMGVKKYVRKRKKSLWSRIWNRLHKMIKT